MNNITLRDYFAGQALLGLLGEYTGNTEWTIARAYELADEMLKQRDIKK